VFVHPAQLKKGGCSMPAVLGIIIAFVAFIQGSCGKLILFFFLVPKRKKCKDKRALPFLQLCAHQQLSLWESLPLVLSPSQPK
jgi:hypothetical protein